jgi:GNAT superfamily N-acetyltransferase
MPSDGSMPSAASYGKYVIQESGRNQVTAHTSNTDGIGKRIGYLNYFGGSIDRHPDGSIDDRSNINGGVIHKAFVSSQFRRKGLASAMLDFARARDPKKQIRHSRLLTDDAKAWSQQHP